MALTVNLKALLLTKYSVDRLTDFVNRNHAVDRLQKALAIVVGQKRRRILVIDREALAKRLGIVVRARAARELVFRFSNL